MPECNLKWLCGLYVLVVVLSGLVSGQQDSLMCNECAHVKHPHDCHSTSKCTPDQMCATSVHARGPNHDDIEISYHCREADLCPGHPGYTIQLLGALLGKKRGNPHHHLPDVHDLVCDECCHNHAHCNAHLCAGSIHGTTTVPPTTVALTTVPPTTTTVATTTMPSTTTTTTAATTPSPAPVYDPDCRDREEDGFACPMLDLFNVCSDSSTLSYVIAHEKCKRHCGVCTPDPNAPVILAATPPPRGVCANYEQDGFKCASMDLFKFCTDPSSLAYVLARKKCPEHCGFCPRVNSGVQSQTAVTSSAALSTTTTSTPFIASTTMAPTAATAVPPSTIGAPAASPVLPHVTQTVATQAPAAATSAATQLPVFTATAVSSGVQSQTSSAALSTATTATSFIASTTMAPTAATAVPPSTIGAPAASPLLPHVTQTVATQAPAAATSAATQLPVFTATAACKNVEENGFSCSYMDILNICTEPSFKTIAGEKCSKHCGFCT